MIKNHGMFDSNGFHKFSIKFDGDQHIENDIITMPGKIQVVLLAWLSPFLLGCIKNHLYRERYLPKLEPIASVALSKPLRILMYCYNTT